MTTARAHFDDLDARPQPVVVPSPIGPTDSVCDRARIWALAPMRAAPPRSADMIPASAFRFQPHGAGLVLMYLFDRAGWCAEIDAQAVFVAHTHRQLATALGLTTRVVSRRIACLLAAGRIVADVIDGCPGWWLAAEPGDAVACLTEMEAAR